MRRFLALILCVMLCAQPVMAADNYGIAYEEETTEQETIEGNVEEGTEEKQTGGVEISAPSAILMEASTGTVIYEKDADTQRPPASVTKIMTLLLIFDALEEGKIGLEDEVTTSEHAASMGGSQVFLEAGETVSYTHLTLPTN